MSTCRRGEFAILKNEKSAKFAAKTARLLSDWNEEYLDKVLIGSRFVMHLSMCIVCERGS
jgi:hypothetical protein